MIPIEKLGRMLRLTFLQVNERVAGWERRISPDCSVITRWNLARILVLGALFSVGTVMYLDMVRGDAADAPTEARAVAARSIKGDARHLRSLTNDDEWRHGPPYIEDFLADAKARSPASPRTEYIPEDELWVSPYYEDFWEGSRTSPGLNVGIRIIPD